MTGSSFKLLQIHGKWHQERIQNKTNIILHPILFSTEFGCQGREPTARWLAWNSDAKLKVSRICWKSNQIEKPRHQVLRQISPQLKNTYVPGKELLRLSWNALHPARKRSELSWNTPLRALRAGRGSSGSVLMVNVLKLRIVSATGNSSSKMWLQKGH